MTWWEEGFDRTRFCRSDSHTYKTPTCCNFMQDSSIRYEIAKFLPEPCLNSEKFQMDVIPYTDILKEIFCTPCTAYEKDKPPKYLTVEGDKVTLNVCKSAARQLWLLTDQETEKLANGDVRQNDPLTQEANSAYMQCGYIVNAEGEAGAEGEEEGEAETVDYFPFPGVEMDNGTGTKTKSVLKWMNDDSFLPSMLSKLEAKGKFKIDIVTDYNEGEEPTCLKLQDGSIYTTLAAATAAALAFIAI